MKTTRAIRGATTVDEDNPDQITERVVELVGQMIEKNNLDQDDLISVLFTATEDVTSLFPATPARRLLLADVPLICARELSVTGGLPLCIRVMAHVNTDKARAELVHVYLHKAESLKEDTLR